MSPDHKPKILVQIWLILVTIAFENSTVGYLKTIISKNPQIHLKVYQQKFVTLEPRLNIRNLILVLHTSV